MPGSGEANTLGAGKAIDAMTGRATQSARTMYVGLATVAVTDADTLSTITEVSTAGYARQAVTFGAPSGDPQVSANSAPVSFGPFTADPPSVGYGFLTSAASGTSGEIVYRWAFDVAKDVGIGDSLQIPTGALTISLD